MRGNWCTFWGWMPFLSPTSAKTSTGIHHFFNHQQTPEGRPFYVYSQTQQNMTWHAVAAVITAMLQLIAVKNTGDWLAVLTIAAASIVFSAQGQVLSQWRQVSLSRAYSVNFAQLISLSSSSCITASSNIALGLPGSGTFFPRNLPSITFCNKESCPIQLFCHFLKVSIKERLSSIIPNSFEACCVQGIIIRRQIHISKASRLLVSSCLNAAGTMQN